MSFSIGIVGLPNVGKSTLFKALTKKQIDIANYPFCTIEPNKGVVAVPDERLSKLAEFSKSKKIVPTAIEFIDIAGIVKGAHKGEGLGNKFLANIREVDAICQVVRDFKSGDIIHVAGKVDPASDVEVINIELAFADLETASKHLSKLKSKLKTAALKTEKDDRKAAEFLETKIIPALENGILLRTFDLDEDEMKILKQLNLLTIKPMIYVLNVDESELNKPVEIEILKKEVVIPICAQLESELAELNSDEVIEYLESAGISMTGLDRIIVEAYKILDLISFITTGEMETKAWTIKRGTKAPQAAGVIHGDFERGFIAAEVINWKDLLDSGSEPAAKEKGLIRLEGKIYEVKDGDVCVFRFSV
ncbi:redox-regulated ATPase YchF [Patescibacteria group bacterium]|nr:redox-regulated ATPase YchF [Patescibacteria group bacterium]